jgi:hypothetical protein
MHFRTTLLQKGLDLADITDPDMRSHPNGTRKVSLADVPLRFAPMEL